VDIPVPRLSYEDLRSRADEILAAHHPSRQIPVPIEQIVEFGFDVTIIPLPGLKDNHEVDAFMSRDRHTMYADNAMLEHRSPNRYRFSLAHELGHIVLHQEAFEALSFDSAAQWRRVMQLMSEPDRQALEWQAYCFAGLILVPRNPLQVLLTNAVQVAKGAGFSFTGNNLEVAKGYISNSLGKCFHVSSQVIEKRLDRDGLWPPK